MKVYNAYQRAVEHKRRAHRDPRQDGKGYGLGEGGEGRNVTHQQKKLNEPQSSVLLQPVRHEHPGGEGQEARVLSARRGISPEAEYIKQRVKAMGGPLPVA